MMAKSAVSPVAVVLGLLCCSFLPLLQVPPTEGRRLAGDINFGLPTVGVNEVEVGYRRPTRDTDGDGIAGFVFNRTIVITTMPFEPLMMVRPESTGRDADDFFGYCKDLLDMMAQELNFTYTLRLPPKERNETAMWKDMFDEIQNGEVDMALTGITVTTERKKIVDLTVPFLYSGLAILYLKPFFTEPPWYAFATALSWRVWLCLAGVYCLAALVFWIAARLSPLERAAAHNRTATSNAGTQTGLGSHVPVQHVLNGGRSRLPAQQDTAADADYYTIGNCFWFLIAALLFRPTTIQPKSTALKLLTVIWWFFSLLLLLLYVHVIAEAYSTTVNVQPIDSVEDLARQNVVKYGALSGGSSFDYFKRSKMALFNHMYETMAANPGLQERSYGDGVKRVLDEDGKYAFIMESVALDYYLTKHCELRRLGSDIARASYSIATAPGSGLSAALSSAILTLQEEGRMWQLDTKWFSYKKECDEGNDYIRDVGLPYLDLYNFGGAILLVLVGLTLGLILALVESCLLSIETARNKHVSIRNQVVQDIRDSIRRTGPQPQPSSASALPTSVDPTVHHQMQAPGPGPGPGPSTITRFYEAEPLSIAVPRFELGSYDPQNTPDYNPLGHHLQQQQQQQKGLYPAGGVQVYPSVQQQQQQQQGRAATAVAVGAQQPARRQMRQQQMMI